jgi:hypothetical protein
MKTTLILIILLLCVASATPQNGAEFPKLTGPYLGQKLPGSTPEKFAPGIVSTDASEHGAPVFSPDGNELYWFSFPGPVTKMMRRVNNQWTAPVVAKIGGNPTFSPDGKKLFFGNRESRRREIVYCVRTDSGWSEKKWIDSLINGANAGWEIWETKSGTIYFPARFIEGSESADICKSSLVNGKYHGIENLGNVINSESDDWGEYGGYVAPDESYIIFSSNRTGGYGDYDLYISFSKKDGTWGQAINLGKQINNDAKQLWPYVSPDGKFLFFVEHSNHTSDIYWVSTGFIDELRLKD